MCKAPLLSVSASVCLSLSVSVSLLLKSPCSRSCVQGPKPQGGVGRRGRGREEGEEGGDLQTPDHNLPLSVLPLKGGQRKADNGGVTDRSCSTITLFSPRTMTPLIGQLLLLTSSPGPVKHNLGGWRSGYDRAGMPRAVHRHRAVTKPPGQHRGTRWYFSK